MKSNKKRSLPKILALLFIAVFVTTAASQAVQYLEVPANKKGLMAALKKAGYSINHLPNLLGEDKKPIDPSTYRKRSEKVFYLPKQLPEPDKNKRRELVVAEIKAYGSPVISSPKKLNATTKATTTNSPPAGGTVPTSSTVTATPIVEPSISLTTEADTTTSRSYVLWVLLIALIAALAGGGLWWNRRERGRVVKETVVEEQPRTTPLHA